MGGKRLMKLKTFQILGYRVNVKPHHRVLSKILTVEAREKTEAEKQGKNYAKMMGIDFAHVIEIQKQN